MISIKSIFNQLVFLLFFACFFISGSLFFENYIHLVNHKKTAYPVLVYSNTIEEAFDIITAIRDTEVYDTHTISEPETLKKMLINKYNLNEFDEITADLTLPYQIDITIKPLEVERLQLFVLDISDAYPENFIQYNDNAWKEIEEQTISLRRSLLISQIIMLIIYLSIQYLNRILYILKNKENFKALLSSGILYRKIAMKKAVINFLFFLFSTIIIVWINFCINYYEILSFIITDKTTHYYFVNIPLATMLILANLILLTIEKPLIKRERV